MYGDRGIKTVQWLPNEILRADDINFINEMSYQNASDKMFLEVGNGISNDVITSGLELVFQTGRTFKLMQGAAISFQGSYFNGSLWGFVSNPGDYFTVIVPSEQDITVDVGDASDRYDTIEIRPVRLNYDPKTRAFKDPVTGAITSAVVNTKVEYGFEFQVLKGTPGGVAPNRTAGWIKLAEIYVPALASTLTQNNALQVNSEFAGVFNEGWTAQTAVTSKLVKLGEVPKLSGSQISSMVGMSSGTIVYNTSINLMQLYDGVSWNVLSTDSEVVKAANTINAGDLVCAVEDEGEYKVASFNDDYFSNNMNISPIFDMYSVATHFDSINNLLYVIFKDNSQSIIRVFKLLSNKKFKFLTSIDVTPQLGFNPIELVFDSSGYGCLTHRSSTTTIVNCLCVYYDRVNNNFIKGSQLNVTVTSNDVSKIINIDSNNFIAVAQNQIIHLVRSGLTLSATVSILPSFPTNGTSNISYNLSTSVFCFTSFTSSLVYCVCASLSGTVFSFGTTISGLSSTYLSGKDRSSLEFINNNKVILSIIYTTTLTLCAITITGLNCSFSTPFISSINGGFTNKLFIYNSTRFCLVVFNSSIRTLCICTFDSDTNIFTIDSDFDLFSEKPFDTIKSFFLQNNTLYCYMNGGSPNGARLKSITQCYYDIDFNNNTLFNKNNNVTDTIYNSSLTEGLVNTKVLSKEIFIVVYNNPDTSFVNCVVYKINSDFSLTKLVTVIESTNPKSVVIQRISDSKFAMIYSISTHLMLKIISVNNDLTLNVGTGIQVDAGTYNTTATYHGMDVSIDGKFLYLILRRSSVSMYPHLYKFFIDDLTPTIMFTLQLEATAMVAYGDVIVLNDLIFCVWYTSSNLKICAVSDNGIDLVTLTVSFSNIFVKDKYNNLYLVSRENGRYSIRRVNFSNNNTPSISLSEDTVLGYGTTDSILLKNKVFISNDLLYVPIRSDTKIIKYIIYNFVTKEVNNLFINSMSSIYKEISTGPGDMSSGDSKFGIIVFSTQLYNRNFLNKTYLFTEVYKTYSECIGVASSSGGRDDLILLNRFKQGKLIDKPHIFDLDKNVYLPDLNSYGIEVFGKSVLDKISVNKNSYLLDRHLINAKQG